MNLKTLLPDRPLTVAVLGASGAVGHELLSILAERDFPIRDLRLLASQRSAGQELIWNKRKLIIEEVVPQSFDGVDLVLISERKRSSSTFSNK